MVADAQLYKSRQRVIDYAARPAGMAESRRARLAGAALMWSLLVPLTDIAALFLLMRVFDIDRRLTPPAAVGVIGVVVVGVPVFGVALGAIALAGPPLVASRQSDALAGVSIGIAWTVGAMLLLAAAVS